MELTKTTALLKEGLTQGLHIGGQVHVQAGTDRLDYTFGEAKPGTPMATESLTLWMSTGKPLTAVAISLLVEKGEVALETAVAKLVPEFAQGGKEGITLWHLLTHTGGFRHADKIDPTTPWPEMIGRICATPIEPGWVPGEKAGYHTASAWFILGEIIQRVSGVSFTEFMLAELFEPLGMMNTHFSFDAAALEKYGDRISIMHSTASGAPKRLPLENEGGFALPRPGSSARGPIAEIGLFYRMLLEEGAARSKQLLKPETVRLFLKPHRVGLYDSTFMHVLDFGLGFILNSNRYGIETVPYGYGRHASDGAFGHSGAESSCAFADPEYDLVVAWALNGMCGERAHQKRARELNSAIYEDLGFS